MFTNILLWLNTLITTADVNEPIKKLLLHSALVLLGNLRKTFKDGDVGKQ